MIHMIVACCLLIASIAQELAVIDATGEAKQFTRRIVSGTFGGGGTGKLPLQLQALVSDSRVKAGGSLLVDFVITNNGQQPITLPISFDPRKVEPKWPAQRSFKCLSLYAAREAEDDSMLLKGGVSLYGAPDAAGTMITLQPSQSIRVRMRIFPVAFNNSKLVGTQTLIARAILSDKTLSAKGADAESASKEIGNVTSSAWTITVEN